jgi:hypothetical protein
MVSLQFSSWHWRAFYSKYCRVLRDSLYVLGLLNSRVLDFVMFSIASTKQNGYYEYKPMYFSQLPIRVLNLSNKSEKAQHDQMVALVDTMLKLHEQKAVSPSPALGKQIAETDNAIDALVYQLYDLTPEEIAIVEGQ